MEDDLNFFVDWKQQEFLRLDAYQAVKLEKQNVQNLLSFLSTLYY
jgi:hypothetical protein